MREWMLWKGCLSWKVYIPSKCAGFDTKKIVWSYVLCIYCAGSCLIDESYGSKASLSEWGTACNHKQSVFPSLTSMMFCKNPTNATVTLCQSTEANDDRMIQTMFWGQVTFTENLILEYHKTEKTVRNHLTHQDECTSLPLLYCCHMSKENPCWHCVVLQNVSSSNRVTMVNYWRGVSRVRLNKWITCEDTTLAFRTRMICTSEEPIWFQDIRLSTTFTICKSLFCSQCFKDQIAFVV
jgi:hypothetical protein